ncbi:MAG: folylpolyglutamate synthase/dihydrofolate synthase family protein [Clostridiales bacterium]|nr:folylpolyglutamate synthase/dihydrofolate synthase family protein [Clostridiales bacterium]
MAYIHATQRFGSKLGLYNIRNLLLLMGDPHKSLKFVHVAGTNGKGSTVAFISSILIAAGYRTGIYTSPFIERFSERIRVGDWAPNTHSTGIDLPDINLTKNIPELIEEISDDDLARITSYVKSKVDIMLSSGNTHPTEFEIVTAIAFQYYLEKKCDVVVLEVGLGGRFDSTNIILDPLTAVITTISYDHMDRLGNTLPEIAFEKAGIIKEGTHVVLYPHVSEVEQVFLQECTERNAKFTRVDFSAINLIVSDLYGQRFDLLKPADQSTNSHGSYNNLSISLLGEHQLRNAVVALRTAEVLRQRGLCISDEAIRIGLSQAIWPGRLEVLMREPLFLIDGAHNIEGAEVLAEALKKYLPERKLTFIVGVLKDRDYGSMLKAILPAAKEFITVTPNSERALPAKELADFISGYCNNVQYSDRIEDAVKTVLTDVSADDAVCAFGSLYFIGEVRRIIKLFTPEA